MDDEMRTAFDRMDRYFGLIQQELERSNARAQAFEMRQEERFNAVHERFNAVDERFNAVDERFNAVDERFNAVDERFNAVDERFNAVDQGFNAANERFISTDEHLRTLTLRIQHFEVRVEDSLGVVARDVTALREQTGQLTNRMKNVEVGIGDLNARVDTLAQEVRQRFRFRGA
jgi:chromosome segregation ATPase